MYRPKDIFLEKDSTKGAVYNRAIDCFNRQLQKESENWHYPQWGEEYISGYRLYDFEKDGVPEMITRHGTPVTLATYVYSYVDGKLVKDYLPDGVILGNGMIGYYRVGTYDRYSFYKHNPDGTFEKVLELEEVHTSPETENDFYINEVQVTATEYHQTGDYYIAEYEKAAYPLYSLFYEEIIY